MPIEASEMPAEELAEADSLALRIHEAEAGVWQRGRTDHTSASLEAILEAAGVDPAHDRHHLALAAYRGFWEPHTHTDPQVRPLWEGLRERGIRVGVLSNTIWSRDFHRRCSSATESSTCSTPMSTPPRSRREAARRRVPRSLRGARVEPECAAYVGDRRSRTPSGRSRSACAPSGCRHSDIPVDHSRRRRHSRRGGARAARHPRHRRAWTKP